MSLVKHALFVAALAAATAAGAQQGNYGNPPPPPGYGGPQGNYGSPPPPPPPGYGGPQGDDRRGGDDRGYGRGGRPSASFYVKDKFNGSRLDLDHPVRSLREYNMNDAISSIDIHSGVWLVCEDDDFRGRCVTLDHSVRRLDSIGMDDKISSVRPIRDGR